MRALHPTGEQPIQPRIHAVAEHRVHGADDQTVQTARLIAPPSTGRAATTTPASVGSRKGILGAVRKKEGPDTSLDL
jgi:hypothetical protein